MEVKKNHLVIAPVLMPDGQTAGRLALLFNGQELPLASSVKVSSDKGGGVIVTVVWAVEETAKSKVELKSFIKEEDIQKPE